jgi:hypothetical protein
VELEELDPAEFIPFVEDVFPPLVDEPLLLLACAKMELVVNIGMVNTATIATTIIKFNINLYMCTYISYNKAY